VRRYQLILGGTAAGIAGVLAFPTRSAHLSIPPAGSTGSSRTATAPGSAAKTSGSAGASGSTSPATTLPGGSSSTAGSTGGAARTATGTEESFRYGDIAVTVTVSGTTITHVGIATIDETDGRSQAIDSYAVPQLEQQVLSAGSADITGVSGATFTSQAFVDSLASALDQLGFRP
jgi:uncharacterized protein with FMN-binding domain